MATVFKKALAVSALVASVSMFVGCDTGDGPIVTPPPTGSDTIYAMTVIHPDGWSPMVDSEEGLTSTATVTGAAGAPAVISLDRAIQPTADMDPWPYADMLGALDATGNLSKLKTVIITYTINSIAAGSDGVSFAITSGYNTGIAEAEYARFHAVLTAGGETPVVGTEVTDTLELADFFISYGSPLIPEGTTLDAASAFLATANSLTFAIENGTYTARQAMQITVSEILLIGDKGLKADMKIVD